MPRPQRTLAFLVLVLVLSSTAGATEPLHERVRHAHANSNGVKIHYVTLGKGPLVVMIHGFPDFWYTWRHQMEALADSYQVVALDMRGYNRSDKPKGVEQYDVRLLVADVAAVIKHVGGKQATIVGHDWGGMVAWQFAMALPGQCSRLVILNLPHPRGLTRELANNPQQQKNSAYARAFQLPGAHKTLTAKGLSGWVKSKEARARYVEAFQRSDFEAMLNYYKRNYPRPPYREDTSEPVRLNMPVLLIHGLEDKALLHGALNRTWEWLDGDLTLVTVPGAGHFVHHDKPEFISRTLKMWLLRDR